MIMGEGKQAAIPLSGENLDKAVARLQEMVDKLSGKISLSLRPSNPKEACPSGNNINEPRSALSSNIERSASDIHCCVDKLQELCDRCEL